MCINIILISFISFYNLFLCSPYLYETKEYRLAYEYISLNDSLIISSFEDTSYNKTNQNICISNRIYYLDNIFLLNKIINYEFSELNNDRTKNLRDSLYQIELEHIYDTSYKINNKLVEISSKHECKYILFFGDINKENKLRAELLIHSNSDDYFESSRRSNIGISFLFYFKDNSINQVIISKWIH